MTSPEPESSWFDPPDTEADPARIRSEAADLRALTGVLTGHGSSVTAVLEQAALCFTDVVADSVLAEIGPDVAALEHAVEVTEWGHAVGLTWADDVERYLAVRESLLAEWRHGLATNFGVVGVPPPGAAPDMAEAYEARATPGAEQAARTELCGILTAQVTRAYEAFVGESIIRAAWFRDGATPANVAALAGTLGFLAGTLWPEYTAVPIPLGADDGAADAQAALRSMDGLSSPEAVVEALERVTLLTRRAESGQPLTPDEVNYLASFYEVMGDRILETPEYLGRSSYTYPGLIPTGEVDGSRVLYALTERTDGPVGADGAAALSVAAANGLLVLSRTGPGGGGFDRLPTWFRTALRENPNESLSEGDDPERLQQIFELAEFVGLGTLGAGDGTSRELAFAVQEMLTLGETFTSGGVGSTTLEQMDAAGQAILTTVGRNDNASFDVVTGSDMPPGFDRDEFFRLVYGFEWSDDGASAAGITDFIRDWATDPARAAQARAATMELVETVVTSESFFDDHVGGSGDPATSSLGQVNPAITVELGLTFASDPGLFAGIAGEGEELLDSATAQAFTNIVATTPDGRTALAVGLVSLESEMAAQYVTDARAVAESGGPMGQLQRIVDNAIADALIEVNEDEVSAAEATAQAKSEAFSLLTGAAGVIPGPFGKGGSLLLALTELLTRPDDPPASIDPESVPDLREQPEREFAVASTVVNVLIEQGRIDPSTLSQGLVGEDGRIAFPGAAAVNAGTDDLVAAADAVGVDVQELIVQANMSYLGNG